jgi:hypothetical protein
LPYGRWKIASVRLRKRFDAESTENAEFIEKNRVKNRGCCRRSVAATVFLFILPGYWERKNQIHAGILKSDVSRRTLGGASRFA